MKRSDERIGTIAVAQSPDAGDDIPTIGGISDPPILSRKLTFPGQTLKVVVTEQVWMWVNDGFAEEIRQSTTCGSLPATCGGAPGGLGAAFFAQLVHFFKKQVRPLT